MKLNRKISEGKNLRIDVLLPDSSQYDVLQHFSRKFFEALQRAGCECRLLEGDQRYLLSLQAPPHFTLGFNGALKIEEGLLFCDYLDVPHIACLVDPPYRFMELTTSPNILITCDDAYCCDDLKNNKSFQNTFFMPHAVEKELVIQAETEKLYDVVMLATFVDCEKRREKWKQTFSKDICRAMQEAVEITLKDEKTSFLLALNQTLKIDSFPPLEASLMQAVFSEVEMYIKGRDKLDLLHSITGHEVHVFGNSVDNIGWNEACQNHPNIIVHPGVPYLEALEIMKRTKILLNSSIKNKHGAHERIFSGSAAGAIVATNDNIYTRKHFIDGQELLLYRRSAFDDLNERVHILLKDEPCRKEMSKKMQAKILAYHTWDHRVAQLLSNMNAM